MSEKQPYREARRRGLGWNLIGTANLLANVALDGLEFVDEVDMDYNSLSPKELIYMRQVKRHLLWSCKVMFTVAARCGVDQRDQKTSLRIKQYERDLKRRRREAQ